MFAVDRGIFLRHDMDSNIAPFLILQNGEKTQMSVLMIEGNPIDYVKTRLLTEESNYEQLAKRAER
ncbi:hypothetical protein GGD38_007632 [Chitinophagaceae bacterium OAS944]|nr:hypothetical protein [Chitinophagaceae bacterium OAS944]